MTNNLQNSPYLPRQRNFPNNDFVKLSKELDKAYIDIANRVNEKTIGLYSVDLPSITGESWYIQGQSKKQQTIRRVYVFNDTNDIVHNINFEQIDRMTMMYGNYTDDINYFGLIAGTSVAIAGQISFYLTPTSITFLLGAGAPTLKSGLIVLEWLSDQ